MSARGVCAAALAAAVLSAVPARVSAAAELPLWELGVGLAGVQVPHYRGAERNSRWALPMPYAVYRGEVLQADRDGVKARLFDTDRVDLDLSLNATPPARSADEPARAGMPDLPATLEFGPNLNVVLARSSHWRAEVRLPLRAAVTLERRARGIGYVFSPALAFDLRQAGWSLGTEFGPLWGSRAYHRHTYDVTPAQATAWRPAHEAAAGFGGWTAVASATRRDGNRWFGAFVGFDSLAGSALRASPLVRRSNNWSAGLAVSWVFAQSGRLVPDPDGF